MHFNNNRGRAFPGRSTSLHDVRIPNPHVSHGTPLVMLCHGPNLSLSEPHPPVPNQRLNEPNLLNDIHDTNSNNVLCLSFCLEKHIPKRVQAKGDS